MKPRLHNSFVWMVCMLTLPLGCQKSVEQQEGPPGETKAPITSSESKQPKLSPEKERTQQQENASKEHQLEEQRKKDLRKSVQSELQQKLSTQRYQAEEKRAQEEEERAIKQIKKAEEEQARLAQETHKIVAQKQQRQEKAALYLLNLGKSVQEVVQATNLKEAAVIALQENRIGRGDHT